MKKISILLALVMSTTMLFAQVQKQSVSMNTSVDISIKDIQKAKHSAKGPYGSRWYNFINAYSDATGITPYGTVTYVNSDTNLLIGYSDGSYAPAQWAAMGQIFNPQSDYFAAETGTPWDIDQHSNYTLDSLVFYGFYVRNDADQSVVDTLVVQIRQHAADGPRWEWDATNIPDFFKDNFNTTEANVLAILTDSTTYTSSDAGVETIKVPLTAANVADSLDNGINYIEVFTDEFAVDMNNFVAINYSFVPGSSYTGTDTLWNYNFFRPFVHEQNGESSYPNYDHGDYNIGHVLDYKDMGDPTADVYYPAFFWNVDFSAEVGYIDFLVSHQNVGIEEVNAKLGNAYPNPANGGDIHIPVAANGKATVMITDITGKMITSLDATAKNEVIINSGDLAAGVYFYTLKANEKTITKKFIVR